MAVDITTNEDQENQKLIDAWNDHMAGEYNPSWLNCLDESMNSWLSKFCPGFMCIPHKPHPFGNEYHTIADGDGGKPILLADQVGQW